MMTTTHRHKDAGTLPKCDTCSSTATHGTYDLREIPTLAGEFKEFLPLEKEKLGCSSHPVKSFTTYLDGRVIPSHDCVPEKTICPQEKTL